MTYSPKPWRQGENLTNWLVAKVASYGNTMFEVSETHPCLWWKLYGYVLDFMYLLGIGVAGTPERKN